RNALRLERICQSPLGEVPLRVAADALLRTRREAHLDVAHAEGVVDAEDEVDEGLDLGLDVLGGAEDVRVVLAETANAVQAVDDAASLVAMQPAEVGDAPGKLAVAPTPGPEDEAVARAVHRLEPEL